MAGELVVDDQQVQLGDWLAGPGTSYCWIDNVLTWWGGADIRTRDTPRSSTNGVRGGIDLLGLKSIVGTVAAVAYTQADLRALIDSMLDAWQPVAADVPLVAMLLGEKRRRYGRPRRVAVDPFLTTRFADQGLYAAKITFQFDALDPYTYSDDEHTVNVSLPVAGGTTMPMTLPVTLAASTSNVGSAMNAGTVPAPWTAIITGPITNPSITRVESGATLAFNVNGGLVLGASDYLLLDSDTKSALLNGTADRRNNLGLGSQWFSIEPGSNSIEFAADAGSGTLALSWRDAYY